MRRSPIDALIFDLSEVLIAGLVGIEPQLASLVNCPPASILPAFAEAPLQDLFCGSITEDDYLAELVARNHWPVQSELLKPMLRSHFHQVIPGMPELLKALADRYELILLSDHAREWIADILQYHDFLRVFHRQFFSYEFGLTKRDPSLFLKVLEVSAKKASRCLFIDDNQKNIAVARSVGMKSLHFSSFVQLSKEIRDAGILLFSSIE